MGVIGGAVGIITSTVCLIPFLLDCDNSPIAKVGESQIFGQTIQFSNMEVNQYLGVPYAEPPVGDLRFMRTKPIQSLPKELTADRQPPACLQESKNPWPWYINGTEKSEDCLYLNIWTPTDASPENTKAVFFWVHGGGFRYGSIRDPVYNGMALAAKGDIVVVTVNYRLGTFGFLSSRSDDAPGNAGLWDQLEGLRWVNKNIQAFGGDPKRITIAGESGGSVSIGLLTVSPLTQNLFARHILQSGSPATNQTANEKNLKLAQELATIVGCADEKSTIYDQPKEVTDCLKNVDAMRLSKADSLVEPHSTSGFRPIYGDEIIPSNPQFRIQNGAFKCTEMLVGATKDEGSLFVTTANPDFFGFFGQNDPKMNKTTGINMMRKLFSSYPNPDDVVNHYLTSDIAEDDFNTVRERFYTAFGDTHTLCPVEYTAEKCAERGKPYFYFWVHTPSTSPWAPWMGAAHYTEVEFVFGQPILYPQKFQREEIDISLNMIQIWSNFVKYGKPGENWPVYSKENPVFAYIGAEKEKMVSNKGPHRDNCNFFRPYFGF